MLRVDRCRDMTFEPDSHYSPDARTGLLSPISYALQRRILLRWENLAYRCWVPVAALTCGFIMVLFIASRGNNFVGSTCAPLSDLLVSSVILTCIGLKGRDQPQTTPFTLTVELCLLAKKHLQLIC